MVRIANSGHLQGYCSVSLSDCCGPVCWTCGASKKAAVQFRFPLLFFPSRHDWVPLNVPLVFVNAPP
jgi:hypothetical protein